MALVRYGLDTLKKLVGVDDTTLLLRGLTQLGVPVEKIDPEWVEVEIDPDRPDHLSAEGLARSLKGLLNIETGLPEYKMAEDVIRVDVDTEKLRDVRPYIVCGAVLGVALDEERVEGIMQLQEKLHDTICRHRRKASIGVYDLDKVSPPLKYIGMDPDKHRFVPLESGRAMTLREILIFHPKGVEYADLLKDKPVYPLLLDNKGRTLSMPPIINSEDTKVVESTKNLLVDVTGFDEKILGVILNIMVTNLAETGGTIVKSEIHYS